MNGLDVQSLIRFLFPKGTRGTPNEIHLPPVWPPDLFGITAHIAQITDCYTELLSFRTPSSVGSAVYAEQDTIKDIGKTLAEFVAFDACPTETINSIQTSWSELLNGDNPGSETWKVSVLRLLIIADVACDGIGFFNPEEQLETTQD